MTSGPSDLVGDVASPWSSALSSESVALAGIKAAVLWLAESWSAALAGAKTAVLWLATHSGIPALVVAALLLVIGYRVLKRSARFFIEVALVVALLLLATHLGWIRW